MTDTPHAIGACGNYCGGCLDYRARAEDSDELRRQVAEAISRELGAEISPEQVGCGGCWGDIHTPWAASQSCAIRQCVSSKGATTCAECDAFPCQAYTSQFPADSEYAENIRAIQREGLDSWLSEKDAEGPPS
jgi:hypothetical protein